MDVHGAQVDVRGRFGASLIPRWTFFVVWRDMQSAVLDSRGGRPALRSVVLTQIYLALLWWLVVDLPLSA